MDLGNNIKFYRTQKKMTQEELAELLGTTSKSISRWEQSLTYPDISLLPFIANIFEITVDELLGVEKIKQDEYIKDLKNKAYEYQKNNDYDNELILWQEAYKKLPNNEEIKICLISIMNTINIVTNEVKYSSEIIKFAESILEKSTNNVNRIYATQCLFDLSIQMNNFEMAEYYLKQLPRNLSFTYDVAKIRYLKNEELLYAIQKNIGEFIDEIIRESEKIIRNNNTNLTDEYKKEYLERLIKIEELVFVKDNDYGYNAISIIFDYIELTKLEIRTTNNKNKVLSYFKEMIYPLEYIINFKPHNILSPFMNKVRCEFIGGYSNASIDLKKRIIKELDNNVFEKYRFTDEYKELIYQINELK